MHRRSKHRARRGGVTVEMALVVGLAFLFFFAALEFCRVAMIRHTVANAAYEAARAAIVPGATSANAEAKAREILNSIFLRKFTVAVSPTTIASSTQFVDVTISVPLDQNLFAPSVFFTGKSVERTFHMRREIARSF